MLSFFVPVSDPAGPRFDPRGDPWQETPPYLMTSLPQLAEIFAGEKTFHERGRLSYGRINRNVGLVPRAENKLARNLTNTAATHAATRLLPTLAGEP